MTAPRPIAVAARELEGPPGGVARWLGEVIAAWRRTGSLLPVVLYVERGLPEGFDAHGFDVRATGPGPGRGSTAWEQVALARALRRDRPAVLLGPANSLPANCPVPGVVVLHDLSFEANPRWFSVREGTRLRLLARWAAAAAARVVAVSEFTAREVTARYGIDPARVRVVPNGVSARFRPVVDAAALAAVRQKHGLGGEAVLSVGSIFNRRRMPDLLGAVALLARDRKELQLVILGADRTHPRLHVRGLADRLGLAARTRWVEGVDDAELAALYSLARVSVYLSEYEGFGLPPLEAAACGSPVLASATSALEENLRGHATLLPLVDHTPEKIAAALAEILDRGSPSDRAAERPAWLERFSWPAAAEAVWRVLEEAAGK